MSRDETLFGNVDNKLLNSLKFVVVMVVYFHMDFREELCSLELLCDNTRLIEINKYDKYYSFRRRKKVYVQQINSFIQETMR